MDEAPVLEIGRILAARDHEIEFGTLRGREHWAAKHDFVSKIHTLSPGVSAEEEATQYYNCSKWNLNADLGVVLECKKFLDQSWPDIYHGLQQLIASPAARPHFILADCLVDAARDMQLEHNIPIAMHCPQMPALNSSGYVHPQSSELTGRGLEFEHATLWQRVKSEWILVKALSIFIGYLMWVRKRRRDAGVRRMLRWNSKPDY